MKMIKINKAFLIDCKWFVKYNQNKIWVIFGNLAIIIYSIIWAIALPHFWILSLGAIVSIIYSAIDAWNGWKHERSMKGELGRHAYYCRSQFNKIDLKIRNFHNKLNYEFIPQLSKLDFRLKKIESNDVNSRLVKLESEIKVLKAKR